MKRRITFYLPRNNCLRVFAPVIAALLRQDPGRVDLRVALPSWPIGKRELQPFPDSVTQLFGTGVTCCPLGHADDLEPLLRDTDVFVTYMPEMVEMSSDTARRLRARSRAAVTWVAVPFLFSQDHFPLLNPQFALDTWDVICTVGPASIRYVETATIAWSDAPRRALLGRYAVTGYPAFDGVARLDPPAVIRRRYGLPADRPVICLSTAPSFYPSIRSSRCARGLQDRFRGTVDWTVRGIASRLASYRYPWMIKYREYLSEVRRLANRHDAVVVGKTRGKHRDPSYVRESVDRLVGDDSLFFPTTALELLSVSDFYVGFHSAMATEAMLLGVPALTALIHPPERVENPDWSPWVAHFFRRPGGVWNVPGVSESINGVGPRARARLRTIGEFPLGERAIDELQRQRVLADYFSWPCDASARVAEVLMDPAVVRTHSAL